MQDLIRAAEYEEANRERLAEEAARLAELERELGYSDDRSASSKKSCFVLSFHLIVHTRFIINQS